jgi:hypothetical protein
MAGLVFVSCGQGSGREQRIARRIKRILRDEFHLDPYVATDVQGLNDIMKITEQLRSSDYYLFVDFFRKKTDLPISLFTHQELALAHHLGFTDIIVLKEKGTPSEGFLRYLQTNPADFDGEDDLFSKVRRMVRQRQWKRTYSRNLVVEEVGFSAPFLYTDHTGSSLEVVWRVRVNNLRPDVAAVGSVCILDRFERKGGRQHVLHDRSYLKWCGQVGYERTILPLDHGDIDLLAIRPGQPGIFLHSLRDTPREPISQENGRYRLLFKLFSQGFQLVQFGVELDLAWRPPVASQWVSPAHAKLL